MQTDLGANKIVRGELIDLLKASKKFTDADMETITSGLAAKGEPSAISDGLKENINTIIQTPEGKKLVETWDKQQVAKVKDMTDSVIAAAQKNPRYNTDKDFRDYVSSKPFYATVADNINQFGKPTRLRSYVEGKDASFTHGNVRLKGDEPFNAETMAKFENNYLWVREGGKKSPNKGAEDIRRRRSNNGETLLQHGHFSEDQNDQYRDMVKSAYESLAERQAKNTQSEMVAAIRRSGRDPSILDQPRKTLSILGTTGTTPVRDSLLSLYPSMDPSRQADANGPKAYPSFFSESQQDRPIIATPDWRRTPFRQG